MCFTGDKFRQYDHGRTLNNRIYGTPEPPEYDLSKVSVPVSVHFSENDLLSQGEVSLRFVKLLK